MSEQLDKMIALNTTREGVWRNWLIQAAIAVGTVIALLALTVDLDHLFYGDGTPKINIIETETRGELLETFKD